jgi:OmpA-OmpF porin, OOP family
MLVVRRFAAASLILGCLFSTEVRAQQGASAAVSDGEFSVQRFEPAIGPHNINSVAGGRTSGHFAWSAGLMFDYAKKPFVVKSCVTVSDCSSPNDNNPAGAAVVDDLMTWNMMASLTPTPRLQIGLRVPVVYVSGGGLNLATGGVGSPIAQAAVGDIAVEAKFRFLGNAESNMVLAGAVDIAAPVGNATASGSYVGNSSPVTVGTRAILDVKAKSFVMLANLRGLFRTAAQIGETSVGPELRYGVAMGYGIQRGETTITPFVEGFGSTAFRIQNGTNAFEAGGGLQLKPPAGPGAGQFGISVSGSAGILEGIGVPVARAIVGISFTVENRDKDKDGIRDDLDECPDKAEDKDGVADKDGCPEEDADHDKLPDAIDRCPEEPETENNYRDDDGCPDTLADADGDGIDDDRDRCPKVKGNLRSGKYIGCADSDGDGYADTVDQCPKAKGKLLGKFLGCPDSDGDGIGDSIDKCPDKQEDGADGDGCPEPPKKKKRRWGRRGRR